MQGVPVTIGGKEYRVPRLRIGPYKRVARLLEQIEKAQAGADPFGVARIDTVGAAMLELLRENYPDLTSDELVDGVALADLDATLKSVLAAAGKKEPAAGEAVSP